MTAWQRPPRPVLGRTIQALAILARLWALPFAVVAWVVGVIVQAIVVGFMVAWEVTANDWAKRVYAGKRVSERKQPPALPDDESEDIDEWDD